MVRTSRRSLLAGLAASPFAAVPALAAATQHPDAALLALEPRIVALAAEVDALCSARSRIEEACFTAAGLAPDKPVFIRSDGSYELGLALYNDATKACAVRYAEAAERLGLAGAEAAHEAADDSLIRACRELALLTASTLDGLILKARMATHDGGTDGDIALSVLEDLVALGGRT